MATISLPVQAEPYSKRDVRPYELFMFLLCGFSLAGLLTETFFELPEDEVAILDVIDNLVCGIFLFDFFVGLSLAQDKRAFLKWGWIDLLSSIPVIDVFRVGRIVRIVRILRVLRGIRLARMLAQHLQRHRADGAFLAVILLSLMLLLLASVAILQVEKVEEANIKTGSDALWWSISTMTTVGYGDRFPVTTLGRIIASALMISGVGLFGTLSGSVASWIMNPVKERQAVDLDAIYGELTALHGRLDYVVPRRSVSLDPQLANLVESWPLLPESTRQKIEDLISASR